MHTEVHQAKSGLIAAMTVFLVVDAVIITARVYVRTFMIRAFGWDDATLCLSFVGFVIACIMGFMSIYFGYAYDGPPKDWPNFDEDKAQKYLYANQLTLYLTSGVAKLAVALVLFRLAINKRFQVIIAASMAVVIVWTFATTLFSSWLCITHGTTSYLSSSTCTAVGLFRTISNVFIDYFYAFLPIFIVKRAKMNTQMKVSVCILLGLGFFASAATIAKLVIIVRLSTVDKEAQEILHYQLLIWADVELGLAIFCASAAALRPLLRRFPMIWGSAKTGSSNTPYGRTAGAGASCDPLSAIEPLSANEREPSHAPSGSSGPSGIQEYELSQMDSDRSLEQQKRCKFQMQSSRG
ncbi:hypothetical protein LA080_015880 [Diaporthe eres]|uniref:Rhodopsin domain-containing protein n=1 Tax=Diaporthe vaccinii TaxID=105482 RepID=A0ABR4EH09_9PEZI|nr:hypothetical protein LA080_015880 [Diaporthe eres]